MIDESCCGKFDVYLGFRKFSLQIYRAIDKQLYMDGYMASEKKQSSGQTATCKNNPMNKLLDKQSDRQLDSASGRET